MKNLQPNPADLKIITASEFFERNSAFYLKLTGAPQTPHSQKASVRKKLFRPENFWPHRSAPGYDRHRRAWPEYSLSAHNPFPIKTPRRPARRWIAESGSNICGSPALFSRTSFLKFTRPPPSISMSPAVRKSNQRGITLPDIQKIHAQTAVGVWRAERMKEYQARQS